MKLSELLKKENNNLDVFRLVAACMVIYGHAYAVVPQAGYVDVVARLLGHDYSGSLAVKIFFFLSGLVVTNSLLHKRDVLHFAIARFFSHLARPGFGDGCLGAAAGAPGVGAFPG